MKDFFISYNNADKRWAEWIAWRLEEDGYTTILQAWDFRPGCNFILEMDRASKEAERTMPVLSPDFLKALYTEPEWAAAFAKDPTGEKRELIPVRVRECEVHGLLGQVVHIDLVDLEEDAARRKLLEGVKRERAKPKVAPAFPTAEERSVQKQPRFPGSLPPICELPHLRNPNFTGREELLESLRTSLTSGKHTALTQQAIAGIGGVGKTQLAIEYSYRYMADYDLIWWVRSEEPATLASDFARLAQPLDLPQKDATEQPVVVQAVRNWLGRNGGWLLIFDNAPGPDDLRDYLPRAPTGHVIITSRNPNWGDIAGSLEVNVWPREESIAFLLKRTGQTDEGAADTLAEELGDLPLALEQAAAYVRETSSTFSGYLDLFRSRCKELWKQEHCPKGYEHTVATTWTVSMDRVREESRAAADLLNLCAFLGPEGIPRRLLTEERKRLPRRLTKAVSDPLKFDQAIASLRRYSLIQADEDSLTIHRLVQAVSRDRLTTNAKRKWAQAAVRLVNDAFPFESYDVTAWPQCAGLLPHALATAQHAENLQVRLEAIAHLLNQAGLYLMARAQFADAKGILVRALKIHEAVFGADYREVATNLNNLGSVLKDLGDLKGAKAHFERALKIAEHTFGPDHPNVGTIVNNLGDVLQDLGDLKGAKAHFQRAVKIDEAAFGPDHPEVATDVNNLGRVLKDLGDLKGAKAQLERALRIDEAALGPNHPNVATAVNNLGDVLKDLGDLKGAKEHFERALKIHEAALGPNHPKVAVGVNNLGSLLQDLGELKDAKQYLERALKIHEATFGPDHPNVAANLNNLGLVLQDLGDLEGAKADFERALGIRRKFLGDDHPETVFVRKNLESLGD